MFKMLAAANDYITESRHQNTESRFPPTTEHVDASAALSKQLQSSFDIRNTETKF